MISGEVKKKYIPTIGIETHVQLKTKTKLFAAVGNDARDAAPNTLISHICTAMPGALPYLNAKAIEMASKAAFALNTEPQKHSFFERKHYFYPDSPMGYQISQLHKPIIVGGYVEISAGGKTKKIRVNRAQLEADAGKNTHPEGADYSLVDLNRAGTPLLEIVSEPDMHTAEEAKAYARELYLLMKYAGISDVDLYHGNMRFDVNVSVSNDKTKLGVRSEVKNLNSFRSVENAVKYEIERQIELLEKSQEVAQETRGWNEAKQKTTSQRGKEEAHDYRYMPEPDIPPVTLNDKDIAAYRKDMPQLPSAIRQKLAVLDIEEGVIEDILDREDIVRPILEAIDKTSERNARRIVFHLLEVPNISPDLNINVDDQITIAEMVNSGQLSSTAGRQVFQESLKSSEKPGQIAKDLNLIQMSDESELEQIVQAVLDQNQQAVKDLEAGENKAIGFLTGQVMAKTQGKANPALTQQIIRKLLGI
jgi:aspartyl-tRNA(Asn)/glutamyl-tRNA(Gln) amidotransferase subunit B